MHTHSITLALAVGLTALAPAAALAQPLEPAITTQNLQSPDARDAAQTAQARQDLRPPDVVDAADGRGTFNSPRVVVVKVPQPASSEAASASGVDWGDAGIGAGGLLGLTLIGAGGAFAIVHRKRTTHHAPPVAGL